MDVIVTNQEVHCFLFINFILLKTSAPSEKKWRN